MRFTSLSPATSSCSSNVMSPTRSSQRYTSVAIILHWVMALGIFALASLGLVMTHLALSPMRLFQLYQLHKSIGITILLAAFLRLAWRLMNHPPALPVAMPAIERMAAAGGHLLLYGFLFALPLTGWALVSASVFDIPTVVVRRRAMAASSVLLNVGGQGTSRGSTQECACLCGLGVDRSRRRPWRSCLAPSFHSE